jgi:hypothetical protein
VKKVLSILGSAALLLTLAFPAAAQHGQGGARGGHAGPARPAPPPQIPARNAGMQNPGAQRDARMTPEERRQLRRDVHDHGRDIYRDRSNSNRP